MGECQLQNYTCNTCVYYATCAPGKAEINTRQILELLGDIRARLARLEERIS